MTDKIKFILNGCDISFVAEAPADITLEKLLTQCDKIKPDWCACGICNVDKEYSHELEVDVSIDYNSIKKVNKYAPCEIKENNKNEQ